jgi:hypothetical protein
VITNKEIDSKVINLKTATEIKGHHVLQDFIESIECIPLETSNDIIVGRANEIVMFDNVIYVHDSSSRSIHMFDKNGVFINTLCRVGKGPNEYSRIKSFFVDEEGNINILCYRKILKFNKELKIINSIKTPDVGNIDDFIIQGKNKCSLVCNYTEGIKDNDFILCMENGRIVKKYDKTSMRDVKKVRVIKYHDTYNIIPPFNSNQILNVDSDFNIKKSYTINYGDNDFLTKGRNGVDIQKGNKFYSIFNFIENDQYVYFSYHTYPIHHCLYNKETGECFKGSSGILNNFPLRINNISEDGKYLIGICDYMSRRKYINRLEENDLFRQEEIDKLKNMNIGDNPFVIKIKLKEQDAF